MMNLVHQLCIESASDWPKKTTSIYGSEMQLAKFYSSFISYILFCSHIEVRPGVIPGHSYSLVFIRFDKFSTSFMLVFSTLLLGND